MGSTAVTGSTAIGGSNAQPIAPTADTATSATSPAPTATPFSVTGQISNVYTGGFLIQAGTGCGYLKVVTTSATQMSLNGQTLKSGVYARAWGTGSCATQIAASAVSLAASATGPFPTPSGAPATSPSAAPTTAPLTAAAAGTASSYTSIVNGQPWPSNFRPYSQYPWNDPLPANPQNVDAANTSRIAAYLGNVEHDFFASTTSADYSHPVYYASSSDPTVSFSCSSAQYGCNQSFSSLHIPAQARPAGGSDHHMAVIQPDGTEYDFWGASYSGGSSLSASVGAVSSVLTSGIPTSMSATSGASLAAGLIRFSEISSGTIPHALFIVLPCTTGVTYPGTTTASSCPDGAGVPIGTHMFLNLSDAQINALPASTAPSYLLPVLHALHQYGGYVEDTGCSGNGTESSGTPCVLFESITQYSSFGQTYPGAAFAAAHGYTNGGQSYVDPSGINWATLRQYMQVLSPCYAQGTCST